MTVNKDQVVAKNDYLSQSEMEVNATYIYQELTKQGWSINAIASTLANMQSESGINPGIYEGLDNTSDTNGFGLVQWTPNTKYKTWADENGYEYGDIDGQIARIIYEVKNGLQWIVTDTYPMTFEEYTKSTSDVGDLAYAFMYNYERPASLDQPERKTNATRWATFLSGQGGTVTPVTPSKREPMKSLFYSYIVTKGKQRVVR